jgi:5'-3' exonuclease
MLVSDKLDAEVDSPASKDEAVVTSRNGNLKPVNRYQRVASSQDLMTSPSSPIIDFYPESFRIDLEGKRADWEGIVLVPFIDEARLLEAEASITPDMLSPEERSRNVLGDILIFTFSGAYPAITLGGV